MPTFRIHIAATADEPIPHVDELPSVEAVSPIAAVEELLAQDGAAR